jgi:4-diphosphocytidyl-2-C-methyl-D-erythritol kinase
MPAAARAFVLTARAKFNVRLEVGRRRADGLHGVRSIVADLTLGDEVAFSPSAGGFSISCDDLAIARDENLAWHAARALGLDLPAVHVALRKTIPQRAGLGGGSADAAATLRGIAAVLAESGITVAPEALLAAAIRVGADVAACLTSGFKRVEGTGEIVTPLAVRATPWGVLLVKPSLGVSTADAYRLLDEVRGDAVPESSGAMDDLADALKRCDFARTCALASNDFTGVIEDAYPSIAQARVRLIDAGASAAILCGSGACVAGLFPDVEAARRALPHIRHNAGEWAAATGFHT